MLSCFVRRCNHIGSYAHVEGIILTGKAITVNTGASFNSTLPAQIDVNLDQNNIMDVETGPAPTVQREIVSEHGAVLTK